MGTTERNLVSPQDKTHTRLSVRPRRDFRAEYLNERGAFDVGSVLTSDLRRTRSDFASGYITLHNITISISGREGSLGKTSSEVYHASLNLLL